MIALIEEFSLSTSLPWQVIAVRLLFATGLGGVLGFEREIAERPAGLRTHMMIALAAAVFAVIALEIIAMPAFSDDQIRTDPLRLVEAITAGVAFLAAGSILMRRGKVQGLTTGAGMWLAGACGLSAGLGLWPVALLSCLLGGLVLAMTAPRTLYDKIWDDHLVDQQDDGTCLLYIDRHLVHEVTSPQAFEGLRTAGRKVRAPEKTLAVVDHNVPTTDRALGIKNEESRIQVEALASNAADFGVEYFNENDKRQGIVHIVGPEQGFTLPGTTIVCGDSHTSTHGAFGALAHGIGTSEVEHVLATQTLIQKKAKNMLVEVDGELPEGVTAKDIILAIIGEIGTAGGTGHVIEFAGEAIRALSMEGRMTVCNMTIEAGARAGLIAPDEKTYAYFKGRPRRPRARPGTWRSSTGRRCRRTRARITTRSSGSTPPRCRRSSPGAPRPRT
jgi:uncharacterized membrane protein YhiD involved in acid resistance